MIRALQKKFVVTAMIAVTVLLLVVLGALNVFNAVSNARQTEFLLDDLEQQNALFPRMEDHALPPPASGESDPVSDAAAMPAEVQPEPFARVRRRGFLDEPMDDNMRMSALYFIADLDDQCRVVRTDVSHIASVTEEEAAELALGLDVDQTGGPMAVPAGGQIVGGGNLQKPRLVYYGVDSEAKLFETKLDCAIGDVTGQQELLIHPEMAMYNDNQLQWYSYLWGDLTDETRIDSPYIAMQTAFLSEGVVLSSDLGRSVTADEIKAMAKSIALREQETEFGTITYDFDDYKA